jgi:LmeA-like phospholipid-binding
VSNYQPQGGWPEQPPPRGGQPGQQGGQPGQQGGQRGQSGGQQDGWGGQQGQQRQQPPYGQQPAGSEDTVPRGVRPQGWQHPQQQPPGYEETVAGGAQQPAWQQSQPGQQPPAVQSRPPRSRRRHRGRRWLIALVVLIVVLVGADFGAKAIAESAIASKIDSSGLGTKPSVDIHGFPFLTQVASRDLSQIDINASNFTVKQVVISSLHATATGVHVNGSFNGGTVDKINGTVVVSFATVTNLIPIPGLTVSADPADGPDAIKFDSSLGGAVGKIEHPSTNVIKVQVGNLTGLAGLASLIGGSAIASSYTFAIPKLPAGLVVRSISVTSQGIVATASAQNTTLSQ